MGNSSYTLRSVVDFARTVGDLTPILGVSGYSLEPALTIGNDVMADMITKRFNWKFNRLLVPPFYTISWQQDYAGLFTSKIGWLESCVAIDINNTALPKPIFWPGAVRDLQPTSAQGSPFSKICWKYNSELTQGVWPGAGVTFTNPLGAATTPANPFINILDPNGNIQVLTQYGVTGNAPPAWPAVGAAAGIVTNDGTCKWTVADPSNQGMRLSHLPPQTAVVYQVQVLAQLSPPKLASLSSLLDPIPDEFSRYFRNGFIAYLHAHSPNPVVKARANGLKEAWEAELQKASGQADKEQESASFTPASSIMGEYNTVPIGPGWPWGPDGPNYGG